MSSKENSSVSQVWERIAQGGISLPRNSNNSRVLVCRSSSSLFSVREGGPLMCTSYLGLVPVATVGAIRYIDDTCEWPRREGSGCMFCAKRAALFNPFMYTDFYAKGKLIASSTTVISARFLLLASTSIP